ncbi:MAG: ABC transporter permease subunit [Propionibacterium sp.]|nr:ABC transporter permease subunit [Propionibacterium sp.]
MNWLVNNWPTVWQALWSHLLLAVPAIALSFVLSVPLGWMAYRYRWSRFVLVTGSSLIYALPSLPLLVVLPAILGTSVRSSLNVVVALTAYGIALMVRSTADALAAINTDTVTSATALGYSPIKKLFAVELPLAGPGLLAGIRVVAVSTVALVTVSAVLGIPSLGTLFTDGFQRGIIAEIITGIVGTALLAVLVDRVLVAIGWLLLPWARGRS